MRPKSNKHWITRATKFLVSLFCPSQNTWSNDFTTQNVWPTFLYLCNKNCQIICYHYSFWQVSNYVLYEQINESLFSNADSCLPYLATFCVVTLMPITRLTSSVKNCDKIHPLRHQILRCYGLRASQNFIFLNTFRHDITRIWAYVLTPILRFTWLSKPEWFYLY